MCASSHSTPTKLISVPRRASHPCQSMAHHTIAPLLAHPFLFFFFCVHNSLGQVQLLARGITAILMKNISEKLETLKI